MRVMIDFLAQVANLYQGPIYSVYVDGTWIANLRTWSPSKMAEMLSQQYGNDPVALKRT